MREIDSNTLNALVGSRAGDQVVVYAWYGGDLAFPEPLPVASWGFSWDVARQVQTFTCEVADPDGRLAPWLFEDPLGVGGTLLQVRYDVGAAGSVNMGWYRITHSAPDERWHSYLISDVIPPGEPTETVLMTSGTLQTSETLETDGGTPQRVTRAPGNKLSMVTGGATISVTANDLADFAKKDDLLAPESPPSGATVVSEVTRLMRDIAPVVTVSGVVDITVSPNTIYEKDRLDAVQDLCNRISCDYRMNGDGQLEIYPLAQQAPVAVLRGGQDGLLVEVDRSQSTEGLYNQFVAEGTRKVTKKDGTTVDVPVRGFAQITAGPLSVDGPFGRVTKWYSSPMITTQAQADAYALEMRDTQIAGMTVDLRVTALPQPHLQQGDWVQVANPVVNGQEAVLAGRVKTMALSGRGAPGPMPLTVQCSYADVQKVIGGVDRG